jgi:hypothetical protein
VRSRPAGKGLASTATSCGHVRRPDRHKSQISRR